MIWEGNMAWCFCNNNNDTTGEEEEEEEYKEV